MVYLETVEDTVERAKKWFIWRLLKIQWKGPRSELLGDCLRYSGKGRKQEVHGPAGIKRSLTETMADVYSGKIS